MAKIYLTRRNLLTLLNKLDRASKGEETARTIWKRNTKHPKFPSDLAEIVAIEDDQYYTDRQAGPTREMELIHAQIPWLQAIDEVMVILHLGVVNPSDSFEVAYKKLAELIQLEIQIACDPAVNGGMTLVPMAFVRAVHELNDYLEANFGYNSVGADSQLHRQIKEHLPPCPKSTPSPEPTDFSATSGQR